MLLAAVYLFLLALLFAFVEIELEGKYGWAEKQPTWYRTAGAMNALFTGKKPLTGYHLFLNLFIIAAFHLPFVAGLPWSLATELFLLAFVIIFFAIEDFLWFVFNPAYGLKSFRKEKIWWQGTSIWVCGLFPIDYIVLTSSASALVFLAAMLKANLDFFISWLEALGLILLLILLSVPFAPLYARWYRTMRTKDDRKKSGIFH